MSLRAVDWSALTPRPVRTFEMSSNLTHGGFFLVVRPLAVGWEWTIDIRFADGGTQRRTERAVDRGTAIAEGVRYGYAAVGPVRAGDGLERRRA